MGPQVAVAISFCTGLPYGAIAVKLSASRGLVLQMCSPAWRCVERRSDRYLHGRPGGVWRAGLTGISTALLLSITEQRDYKAHAFAAGAHCCPYALRVYFG